jgi:succinate dehydrogenase / fumarate reductase membrane anchor subunit
MSLRSPLSGAVGHGAAGNGVGHWWQQRVTAIALVPLTLWFVFSLAARPSFQYLDLVLWLQRPWNAVLTVLLVVVLALHSKLGVQVVIEDYVHGKSIKLFALVASLFAHVAIAVAGVFAVIRIALGAAA